MPSAPAIAPAQLAQWRAEWETDAAIRAEFRRSEDYVAFKKAEARGGARIIGNKAAAR